jgi:hypothetical protein
MITQGKEKCPIWGKFRSRLLVFVFAVINVIGFLAIFIVRVTDAVKGARDRAEGRDG